MMISRPVLHTVRMVDAILFWPVLAFVVWGELSASSERIFHTLYTLFSDKALHFQAYFLLGAMAAAALKRREGTMYAVIGLILLGASLEVIQFFVGRDADAYDELANTLGAISGAIFARAIVEALRRRWAYK